MADAAGDPRAIIIVPARFASTRFPGKPLEMLRGATGVAKPLIERSWEAAMAVPGAHRVVIATDDERIGDVATRFGAEVVMTGGDCANGTERCADAIERLGDPSDIIINLQGDAPLTPAVLIERLIAALARDPDMQVATPVVRCDRELQDRLLADEQAGRVGGTTAVFDARGQALYFSKKVLPYIPADRRADANSPVHLHLGVYAYRRAALMAYRAAPAGVLEQLEGLEQLRYLNIGMPVKIVESDPLPWSMWELNNPVDVAPIEAVLRSRGMI